MKPILEVKDLWKKYARGAQQEKYLSLRDSFSKIVLPKARKEKFWALKDIDFKVDPGDSLAIIGKNGAGKSTLLKILSKITPPTRGEIVLRGRLSSLLEVGTGFHPELTGRENIYLNGSILGLGRQEINRQFDAIVDFSGVEAFLDTPLKHYSSGMQLRLAFAVAAHLEPEILVIDEVLAVGDSVFQQKCIDKMTEVSHSGRTILFVSHNIQAIRNLCRTAIQLQDGQLINAGSTDNVIQAYSIDQTKSDITTDLSQVKSRRGKGNIVFDQVIIPKPTLTSGDQIRIGLKLTMRMSGQYKNLEFGIAIQDLHHNNLIHISNKYHGEYVDHNLDNDIYWFEIDNYLKSGRYKVVLFLRSNEEIEDWISDWVNISVAEGNRYGYSNSSEIQGLIQPDFTFRIQKVEHS